MDTSTRYPRTIVVLGASVAGLLAAAAAAPHADRVVVVERDTLPEGPAPRSGTPQVAHAHGLLASGRRAMADLLPGLEEDLLAHGAVSRGDMGNTGRWWIGGGLLADCEVGLPGMAVSRLALESALRDRIRKLADVELRDGLDTCGLLADGATVTGVRVRSRDGGAVQEIAADLVIDATGRAGRSDRWFTDHGWTAPRLERVKVGVRYATTHVEARAGDLDDRAVSVSAATPEVPRGGVAILQEDDTWIVMLFSYGEQQPPLDPDGFRRASHDIVSPDLATLLADRPLLHEPRAYRFPDCRRRHFEELATPPAGYVALGDAMCSFDPTFGQGMSVAALQALALRDELSAGLADLPTRFHHRAAAVADGAWTIVVGADLAIEGVEGERPRGHAVISRYVRRAQRVARHDPVVARASMRVTNLLAAPPSLLSPGIAWRVLRG